MSGTLRRAPRAAASAAGLLVAVGAVPALLFALVGNPLPSRLPTWAETQTALADGWTPPDRFVVGVLSIILWVLWARLMGHLYTEVRAHRARPASGDEVIEAARGSRRGLSRRIAGWLVGGIMAAGPLVPTAAFAAPAPIPAVLTATQTPQALSPLALASAAPSSSTPFAPALDMPDQVTHPLTSPGPAPAPAPPASRQHTVRRGDSPWRIAEQHLGAGERWRELRHSDGRSLTSREMIHPGQVLLLPPAPDTNLQAAAAPPPSAPQTVVVRPGDSLSEIAERELGDANEYPDIWTANRGRVMPDGRRFADPDLIHPGWPLLVPQPTNAPAPPAEAPEAIPAPADVVEAPEAPPAAPPTTSPAQLGTSPAAPPTASAAPLDTAPALTSSPPAAAPAPAMLWPPPPPLPAEPAPGTTAATTPSKGGRQTVPAPVGVGAAGLAGAAVIGLLARRRRAQMGQRRPGRRPPLPTGYDARVETSMRAGADPGAAAVLDDALAVAATVVDEDGGGLPEILGAHLTSGRVELLLASAGAAVPEPFEASADGLRWTARSSAIVEPTDRPSNPAPAMVTLGETDAGTLLVNLETIGLLALEGDQQRAAGVVRRMAFELGAPFLAAIVNVILVGLPEVAGLEAHVERAGSLGEALDRAARLVGHREEQLASYGAATGAGARAAGVNSDTWAPVVILAAGPVTDEDLQRAAEVTADPARSAVAVVVTADHTTARWALDLDDEPVDVGPLGFSVDPDAACETSTRLLGYEEAEAEAVSGILETALRQDDVAPNDPPYDALDDGWGWPTPDDDTNSPGPESAKEVQEKPASSHLHLVSVDDPEPMFEIGLRVLGPIEIDATGVFTRGKSRELVVALALQRSGLTTGQLDEYLWAGTTIKGTTRNTTVSDARAGLRRNDQENLIPYGPVDGSPPRYRLDPRVGTDWDRYRWLARTAVGASEADRLTEALDLVRGEPLGGPTQGWTWAQPHMTEMMCAIGDTAHRLAQLRLEALDLPRAAAAARAGLRGSPWDQRLYGDLMLIADAAGNPGGVNAVWDELVSRLRALDEEDSPHPDIEAVYRRCRDRKHRAT